MFVFDRVYDNALANAVMQQAAIILQVEESMPRLRRFYDNHYIHDHCAPLGEFYDDDVITDPSNYAEMKKITSQIKVCEIVYSAFCALYTFLQRGSLEAVVVHTTNIN